ncbi:hypothetical protein AX17_003910 [Amanita inopinata Kibby_2008]|nr:hypothetical protein AX17_003910 [Amanita inopinata Kibby_2008]
MDSPRKSMQPVSHAHPPPPIVTIDSPRSVCSPPRSPRLSGLLFALRDVIGEDLEDGITDAPEELEDNLLLEGYTHEGDAETTVTIDTHGDHVVSDSLGREEPIGSAEEAYSPTAVIDDFLVHPGAPSPHQRDFTSSFEADNGEVDEDSIEDSDPTIRASLLAPRDAEDVYRNVRRSSRVHSQILVPPEIDLPEKDEEMIDSGYAEHWQPPSPLVLSSPRSPAPNSTLDLLASPFGSSSSRVLACVGVQGKPCPLGDDVTTEDEAGVTDPTLDLPVDDQSSPHLVEESYPTTISSDIMDPPDSYICLPASKNVDSTNVTANVPEEKLDGAAFQSNYGAACPSSAVSARTPDSLAMQLSPLEPHLRSNNLETTDGDTSKREDSVGLPSSEVLQATLVASNASGISENVELSNLRETGDLATDTENAGSLEGNLPQASGIAVNTILPDASDMNDYPSLSSPGGTPVNDTQPDITGIVDSDVSKFGVMEANAIETWDLGDNPFHWSPRVMPIGNTSDMCGVQSSPKMLSNVSEDTHSIQEAVVRDTALFTGNSPQGSSIDQLETEEEIRSSEPTLNRPESILTGKSVTPQGTTAQVAYDSLPEPVTQLDGSFSPLQAAPSTPQQDLVDVPSSTDYDDFANHRVAAQDSDDVTPNLTTDADDDDNASISPGESPQLAYLAKSRTATRDSDPLQSYEGCSNVASPEEVEYLPMLALRESSQVSKQQSIFNSSPNDSPRRGIFTPPAETSKSNTVIANSPSVSSASGHFSFQDRGSASTPPSASIKTSHVSSAKSSSAPNNSIPPSRKVNFGWKYSGTNARSSDPALSSRLTQMPARRPTHPFYDNASDGRSSGSASPARATAGGLKPLRLSALLNSQHASIALSHRGSVGSNSSCSRSTHRASLSSTSVSSAKSSHNLLLSPARISSIPEYIRNSILSSHDSIPSPLSDYSFRLKNFGEPHSAPISPDSSRHSISMSYGHVSVLFDSSFPASSGASEPDLYRIDEQEDSRFDDAVNDQTIRQPVPAAFHSHSSSLSVPQPPMYAIATPRPALMFAIASDNVDEVRRVLDSGGAGPNETVGPQSALEFALTNNQLTHKMEIVKLLLAYGADPTVAMNQQPEQKVDTTDSGPSVEPSSMSVSGGADTEVKRDTTAVPATNATLLDGVDPATRYYVEKADEPNTRRTSALMHRSSFRALTRVRYEIVGQDRALEQLFRILSIHTRQLSSTPIVVLLCGPSGHGKSLLARKFGSLLDVPTHTVNMTTLRSTYDLWKSYSMSPYETPTTCTLAEFLINNEGKRCVVVLDEIEKTEDEKTLWSLLMPWELGRCSVEAGSRHVDVRNVVWLGTSNIGHDMILEYQQAREYPREPVSREEYVELMGLLRPRVSERLGASVLSRVTTVLPFVPFTEEEKKVICSEALYTLAGEAARELSPQAVDKMINSALASYCVDEGARSLYRAVSSQLIDFL